MENLWVCIIFYFCLVMIELIPNFKKKQKRTVIFTTSILAATFVLNILAGFNIKFTGITDIVEKALEFIYKI